MADTLTYSSATSTIHTYLLINKGTKEAPSWKKLIDIKDYPDFGGTPEKITTTTMSNEEETSTNGVKTIGSLEFLSNYTVNDYESVKELEQSAQAYEVALAFGKPENGAYGSMGSWKWNGQISTWLTGGSVNSVREMKTSISKLTDLAFSKETINVTTT